MKKLFLTLALAAATMVGANAQFILGGTIGGGVDWSKLSDKDESDNYESTTDWDINFGLKFGYGINDKMELGLKAGIGYDREGGEVSAATPLGTVTADKADESIFGWNVTPYFRYALLTSGNFSLGLQADLNVFGGSNDPDIDNDDNEISLVGVGINVKPYVAYTVGNFVFDAELNIIGLGYNYASVDAPNGETDCNFNSFGLNVNSHVADASMGDIVIGVGYKF